MSDNFDYSVVVIGGGPAGMATSLSLSARGIRHCLVDATDSPVAKPGEALPPNAKPLLKKLGIMHLMEEAAHAVYYGNRSSWGNDTLEQKEFIAGIHGHGYLLNRWHFEKQLRQFVKSKPNTVKEGCSLKKITPIANGVKLQLAMGSQSTWLTANYVVDATGRKASVCRHLGEAKKSWDTQFAIILTAKLTHDVPHQVTIEATENGWWYAAPQQNKELIFMFFTLKELLPSKSELPTFIEKERMQSMHISKMINQQALQFENVKIMPTGTSRLDVPYGNQWIAVGDAAFSFDPISSYGITSALASGYYAGHALAGVLENQTDALLAYRYVLEKGFEVYLEKLKHQYAQENRWANSTYWKYRFKK